MALPRSKRSFESPKRSRAKPVLSSFSRRSGRSGCGPHQANSQMLAPSVLRSQPTRTDSLLFGIGRVLTLQRGLNPVRHAAQNRASATIDALARAAWQANNHSGLGASQILSKGSRSLNADHTRSGRLEALRRDREQNSAAGPFAGPGAFDRIIRSSGWGRGPC
jgi:hypothetical protein